MSIRVRGGHGDMPGRFNEDAPRPPVPGEEDSYISSVHPPYLPRPGGPSATPRRSDLDLGFEPEGCASPAPPHLRWAESLHFLLDDRDGTALFRAFLLQEGCSDLLDFWFACSGFRKLPPTGGQDGRRLRLAKAIYRKYIADSGGGVVARKIKPATKSFIRECVCRAQLDSALFEQAQVDVQTLMEEHTYPLFLKSDVYLAFAQRSGADDNSPRLSTSPGNQETSLPGYLPTLMEDKEWTERTEPGHAHSGRLTQKLLIETAAQRNTANQKRPDHWEAKFGVRELVNPYYINSGFARAPVASANDSELQSLSSDADTISLTDSSVDGIPPYRFRKQQRRNMQENVKANGHVPLPHIPRTHRLPKDVHVEPQKFAAELISRLELIQRERENQRKLEEKLQRVRMEEECEDADVSTVTSLPGPCLRFHGSGVGQWNDDAQAILDEHLQRVMKSPGCQSPKTPSHAHADSHRYGNGGRCYSDGMNLTAGTSQSDALGYSSRVNSLSRRSLRGNSDGGRGMDGRGLEVPEEAEQKQKQILQWMMEGERDSGRYRKSSSSVRPGWVSGSDRYDAVPSTSQSEEGRRRSAPQHSKQRLKSSCSRKPVCENITVAYYFCGEPIPYRTSIKGRVVTLGQFKELLTKKGSYRFYFKKVSDEFDCGVVYEEVHEDDAVLPIFEDRIIGKVEKID
ncbi:axin-1-like isoform X1 [Colossoma macropomum]|uniref:axin-1-like isoform X1 n=1 Tax=Colossoma macropomum TaxID=42526 RepID=UPI0018643224|nr:axin-1-like isoform X1 [Colossoma macropomum]